MDRARSSLKAFSLHISFLSLLKINSDLRGDNSKKFDPEEIVRVVKRV